MILQDKPKLGTLAARALRPLSANPFRERCAAAVLEPAGPWHAVVLLLAVAQSKFWGRRSSGDERGERRPLEAAWSVTDFDGSLSWFFLLWLCRESRLFAPLVLHPARDPFPAKRVEIREGRRVERGAEWREESSSKRGERAVWREEREERGAA